ncbi:MAG TPA: cellulase family glycosylhydrolase [Opitutaceae bacterium]|nr:cellulase family glycosylhydrolase [Opitutaceae bacterium]
MKIRSLPLLIMAVATSLTLHAAPTNPSGFVIRRGTNLSHWLSQDFGWFPRESFITENDIAWIARTGFDHVRVPIDEKEMWHEDGRASEAAFAVLTRAIDWSRAHGLRVVVDLHTVRTHHFNAVNEGGTNTLFTDPSAQERFLDLWREISARLRHYPVDSVAYEIMNEPVADDHEDWNKLIAAAFAALRPLEPNRVIVLGSNRWQIPSTLPHLKVPEGDRNIILSTHTYSPMLLTHYRANWTPLKIYTGAVRYPGPVIDSASYDALMKLDKSAADAAASSREDWNAARIAKELEPAIRRAKELDLQLYCGEFGCLPTVPRADRLAYYRDIISVFDANGIAWANWEYKGDFGLLEWHGADRFYTGAPDVELLDALLSGAKK